MKPIYIIVLLLLFANLAFGQKIAFQKIDCKSYDSYSYLNNAISNNLINAGLNVFKICLSDFQESYWGYEDNNFMAGIDKRGILDPNKLKISASNLIDLGYSFLIVPIEFKRVFRICTNAERLYKSNDIWWCKFYIYNLENLKYKEVKLTISTSESQDLTLENSSNINNVVSQFKGFIN
jgi:hypothetical protein